MNTRSQGFTLLEILIALSLTGLLLVLMGAAISASRYSLNISEHYAARLDEVRTAQTFLRRALTQALALPRGKTSNSQGWVFQGEPQRLSFSAALPASLQAGQKLHTLGLIENSAHTYDLQIAFTQLTSDEQWGQDQRLLRQLRNLRLSYRGLDDHQHQSQWLATWPWPQRLPGFVRIELDADGPVQWTPLVVALRTSQGRDGEMP